MLIVGGGPSGLAAAAEAVAAGLDVTLVERDARLGGSAICRGIDIDREPQGVRILTGSTCLGIYPESGEAGVAAPTGPVIIAFSRLVVATGAYDRPLAYRGNDLPGTVGVRGFERLAAQQAFTERTRLGLVAAPEEARRADAAAHRAGLRFAWATGPIRLQDGIAARVFTDPVVRAHGRRRVRRVDLATARALPTDVLVIGFSQPTYQLAIHAGARASVMGSPAVVRAVGADDALIVGEAAGWVDDPVAPTRTAVATWLDVGQTSRAADAPTFPSPSTPSPEAFACFCEDVRIADLEAAVTDGFTDAELVKRRTGAGTGPCQGAYCLGEVTATLEGLGIAASVPTIRPPMHPVRLADLAADA
ncbi:MAG TPA: NAD(P)-binding protein [Actinomycetota bacterium]|nr:NAD(P)-binding protein [Actinomycetota bacterium]